MYIGRTAMVGKSCDASLSLRRNMSFRVPFKDLLRWTSTLSPLIACARLLRSMGNVDVMAREMFMAAAATSGIFYLLLKAIYLIPNR